MQRICEIESEQVCGCCCRRKLFYRGAILFIIVFDVATILGFIVQFSLVIHRSDNTLLNRRFAENQVVFMPVYIPWCARVYYGGRWVA